MDLYGNHGRQDRETNQGYDHDWDTAHGGRSKQRPYSRCGAGPAAYPQTNRRRSKASGLTWGPAAPRIRDMATILTYPPVTDQLLAEVVRRVLSVGSPHKIVLFGSWARGNARPDSDLDLLIIEDSTLPRYRRSARYRRALCGVFPAKDVVVWTPSEVEEWKAVPHAFISTVLSEGKLLYER